MKKPCIRLKIWDKNIKWVEFWVKNLNLCFKIWVCEKFFKLNAKACQKVRATREREREREREVPRPNTAPFSLCLFRSQAPPISPHLPRWICCAVSLNSLNLLCHAVLFRCQTRHTMPCCTLPNLLCFATHHRTLKFCSTHKAQAPPRSKALR
mgnify:CR=1 FL=1